MARFLLGICLLLVAFVFHSLFEHLLYDWVVRTIEETLGVKEADLIASVTSYVLPALIATGAIFTSYRLGIHQASGQIDIAILRINRVFISVDFFLSTLPILVVEFTIANPGPATTFRDWELEIDPARGKRIVVSISGNITFGDDYGNLSNKALETGAQRSARYAGTHPLFDFMAMRRRRSSFIVRAYDVRDRQVRARYVLTNDIEIPIDV